MVAGKECWVNLMYDLEYIKRHKKFDQNVINILNNQDQRLVLNKATKESRTFHDWGKQVGGEAHRIISFTRLKISDKGILYSEIFSEHKVEDIVINFFHRRFPKFLIVIGSKRIVYSIDKFGVRKKHLESVKNVVNHLEKNYFDEFLMNLNSEEDMWKTYYYSQNILQRRNKKLQVKMMPKKYMKHMGIENEFYKGNKKLDEF